MYVSVHGCVSLHGCGTLGLTLLRNEGTHFLSLLSPHCPVTTGCTCVAPAGSKRACGLCWGPRASSFPLSSEEFRSRPQTLAPWFRPLPLPCVRRPPRTASPPKVPPPLGCIQQDPVGRPGPGQVAAQLGARSAGIGRGHSPSPPSRAAHILSVPACQPPTSQPGLPGLVQIPNPPRPQGNLYLVGRLSPPLSLHVAC